MESISGTRREEKGHERANAKGGKLEVSKEVFGEKSEKKEKEMKKKRGRKSKDEKEKYVLNKEQAKFFIDLSKDEKALELVQDLLVKVNDKSLGKEITIKELALSGMAKLSQKDIEKIQEESLSEMEKVEKALADYNRRNNLNLGLGEFLVKKLNIN